MSVIATALRELMAAGVTGEALVAAVERIEAAQVVVRRGGAAEYVRDVSAGEWADLRAATFARDGFACVYCGCDAAAAPQCDHVLPLVRGGSSVLSNLVTACKHCNSSKGGRTLSEWRRP